MMGIFGKKENIESEQPTSSDEISVNERPRICCIDLSKKETEHLQQLGYNIFSGTLGTKIRVPNSSRYSSHELLLNFDFPENLHEYDIIILDLDHSETTDYKENEHIRKNHTGKSAMSLLSSYPETIFDPRPLSSTILKNKLAQIGKRPHMIIAFTSDSYNIEYEPVRITEGNATRQGIEKHNIYAFADRCPLSESKSGKELKSLKCRDDMRTLLDSHLEKFRYNQTFYHPTVWDDNGKNVPDPNFFPIIENSSNDIVSICESRGNSFLFYFPQLSNKSEFISQFLSNVATSLLPELFPFSTTFNWKNEQEYWLPNHINLEQEKKSIIREYENKIQKKEEEIDSNIERYSFLHNLLTETGDKLVTSVIEFLKWVGFKNAINADELKEEGQILEEDIQIEFENGLIIIECKGIGGTSTDSNCSQISKIKHRRCKERGKFDVFALYLVNHQRYLPPLQRKNPPFTEHQIQDAASDERGLLSTWQLFNLYYEIEDGISTKEEARNAILDFGLIEFKPTDLEFIDEPKERFKNGLVCIVNIDGIDLKIGDEIFIEKSSRFSKRRIEGIQVDDKPVTTSSTGQVGLQFDKPVKKKTKLWKKKSS